MIDNTEVIDFIGINEERRKCVLAISDHHDWENELNHLLLLQEKLNNYISFIESGEIYIAYPEAQDKDFGIEIHFMHEPSIKCLEFLKHVYLAFKEANVEVAWVKQSDE